MKRQAIHWAVALFFITLFSCEKNKADPECKDASCCKPERNEFVEYIQNVPARLGGPPEFSTWAFHVPIGYPTSLNKPQKSGILAVCESSMDKISGLVPEKIIFNDPNAAYSYKISGKVLKDVLIQTQTAQPVLYIYIDKIEKIKP